MKDFRLIAFICGILFLTGCSSQFAYNNLDWLIHWYIDDYVELDKKQKSLFDDQMADWLVWHRQEELVQYKTHLEQVKQRLAEGPLTAEDVSQQFDSAREHWARLRNKITPEILPLAKHLSDEQITAFFDKLEEQNAERYEERANQSQEEIFENIQEGLEEDVKEYVGKLTKRQKELVAAITPEFVPNRIEWIKYRRNIQAAAKALMLQRNSIDDFESQMTTMVLNPEVYQHELYKSNSQHNRALYARLIADVMATLTAKQKKRLNRKIDNLIEDLQELIEDS